MIISPFSPLAEYSRRYELSHTSRPSVNVFAPFIHTSNSQGGILLGVSKRFCIGGEGGNVSLCFVSSTSLDCFMWEVLFLKFHDYQTKYRYFQPSCFCLVAIEILWVLFD